MEMDGGRELTAWEPILTDNLLNRLCVREKVLVCQQETCLLLQFDSSYIKFVSIFHKCSNFKVNFINSESQ